MEKLGTAYLGHQEDLHMVRSIERLLGTQLERRKVDGLSVALKEQSSYHSPPITTGCQRRTRIFAIDLQLQTILTTKRLTTC